VKLTKNVFRISLVVFSSKQKACNKCRLF
jgi:hypothetical protein